MTISEKRKEKIGRGNLKKKKKELISAVNGTATKYRPTPSRHRIYIIYFVGDYIHVIYRVFLRTSLGKVDEEGGRREKKIVPGCDIYICIYIYTYICARACLYSV